jgi:hypothetical protein
MPKGSGSRSANWKAVDVTDLQTPHLIAGGVERRHEGPMLPVVLPIKAAGISSTLRIVEQRQSPQR